MTHPKLLPVGTIIHVEDNGTHLIAIDQHGNDVTESVPYQVRRSCFDADMSAELRVTTTGGTQWRKLGHINPDTTHPSSVKTDSDIKQFLATCYALKPAELKMAELPWKFALRSVLRGDNLLLRGDSGCGKTMLASIIPEVLNRPYFFFNLGGTQDPRSTLIGNTHFKAGEGTFVAEALFVRAIQTPDAIILLDELSRAHPEAHNILMTVLDPRQRYLRIDERPDTPTVKVAQGVSFIATANVGSEYTATRVMDRALLDRFTTLVIPTLTRDDEIALLADLYPSMSGEVLASIADIADESRKQVKSDVARINTAISTRMTVKLAGLLHDGFTLVEAAEVCIFPFYSESGGPESEQTYMRQLVQNLLPSNQKVATSGATINKKKAPWE